MASPPCRPKFAGSHARGSDARALERDDDRDRDGHRATAGCGGASSFGTFPRFVATRVAFRDAARLLGCRIFLGRPAGRALRVVIVGGGIGGLAACVALRRVGVDAHVYERATELRSNVGTGIALWPNGLKALRCIGPDVEREVASRGRAISGMRMGVVDDTQPQNQRESPPSLASKLRDAAVSLAGAAFPRVMRARHGAGLVCVRWADAQAALASFLPPSVIHLDASIDAIDAVRFADGTEGVRCAFARRDGSDATDGVPVFADALVGADGVNSAVRAALLDDGPPRDNGRVIWRGVVDAADVAAREDSSNVGKGVVFPSFCPEGATALKASKDSAVGRTVCYMDVGGGKLYWAAGCLDEGVEDAETAIEDVEDAETAARASCAATFASYPDVLACLDATPRDALYVSRVLDRPPLFPDDAAGWTGPVTLLGDAAHPVIPSFGQGANLALEDAAELATALANARREDIVGILRRWERARYARTSEAQVASFLSGSKSYGARKFADAVAASGLTDDALSAHREKFPTANDSQTALMGWRPTFDSPLCELAPAAAMALARRAANDAAREPRLPDDVPDEETGGGAGRRGTLLGALFTPLRRTPRRGERLVRRERLVRGERLVRVVLRGRRVPLRASARVDDGGGSRRLAIERETLLPGFVRAVGDADARTHVHDGRARSRVDVSIRGGFRRARRGVEAGSRRVDARRRRGYFFRRGVRQRRAVGGADGVRVQERRGGEEV